MPFSYAGSQKASRKVNRQVIEVLRKSACSGSEQQQGMMTTEFDVILREGTLTFFVVTVLLCLCFLC